MDVLTRDKNLDMEILMKLEDHELGPVCSANKYINSLCKDPIFWYNRLIKKIKKSYRLNLKLDKNIKKIDINGEKLEDMKDYFGFESLPELNNFLNEFSINILYYLYSMYYKVINMLIDNYYVFDDNKLPKYINKEELIFYLRRELTKEFYKNKTGNRIEMDFPELYIKNNIPGFRRDVVWNYLKLPDNIYDYFKKLGVRT